MSPITSPYVYATEKKQHHLVDELYQQGFYILNNTVEWNHLHKCQILVLDYDFFKKLNFAKPTLLTYEKLILLLSDSTLEISPIDFQNWAMDDIINESHFKFDLIVEAIEQIKQTEQERTFIQLTDQLNEEYEKLKQQLENQIAEKKQSLLESRQKILDSNNRIEALRKILFSLFQEFDIPQIETSLNDLLPSSSKAVWIKIIHQDQANQFEKELKEHLNTHYRYFPAGHYLIYFIKADQKVFKKEDLDLFKKICDVIQINFSRDSELKKLFLTEKIVSTAFDQFSETMTLVDKNYNLIKSNRHKQTQQKKCYELLFNRTAPCKGCSLGTAFELHENGYIYDVASNKMLSDNYEEALWVHIYTDKTAEYHLEKQIQQNAKLNELGIISSSIAHELNNPIGGLMSYLQLLLMDLPKDHILFSQIQLMYETSLKVKKIIEDLLVFSRKQTSKEVSEINISRQIQSILSLYELSFKNHNIKVVNRLGSTALLATTSTAVLNDCLNFMLNFFAEKFSELRKQKVQIPGLVEVDFFLDQRNINIIIRANCGKLSDADKAKDIRILALNKTANEQNMTVEMEDPNEKWTQLKLVIPKSGN